jgi:peptide chain release factor subunit 1
MLQQVDLKELAAMAGAERAFVSLYLSGREALSSLADREERVRRLLAEDPVEGEHFTETMDLLRAVLAEEPVEGPLALFASWAADVVLGYPLPVSAGDLLWVDAAPYIRPLAELQDEYKAYAVVFADNRSAEVYLAVATDLFDAGGRIRGDVKNHVKKGGWSQKRYQRRRANELLHYAKEVAGRLEQLVGESGARRIVLVGSREACLAIREALPEHLAPGVVEAIAEDLAKETQELMAQAVEATLEREREDEQELWGQVREEAFKDGLAALGPREVLAAAKEGRVDVALVERDLELEGMRCRDCELLALARPQQCPQCGSTSVFAVDLVEGIVEQLALTGARADFVPALPGLAEHGGVAALLRW